jgi:hypothetical protein
MQSTQTRATLVLLELLYIEKEAKFCTSSIVLKSVKAEIIWS